MTLKSVRLRLLRQRRFRQLIFGAICLSIALGFIIVPVEAQAPHRQITTLSDGLWWAFQTLTTVGYGDLVPVTLMGRLIGVIMLLLGTIMFGVVIATISTTMSRSQEEFYWNRLFERMNAQEQELAELKKQLEFLVKDRTAPPPTKT